MRFKKLPRTFFDRPTLTVAQELLGKTLVYNTHRGRITETEAISASMIRHPMRRAA